ncbi:MarR family transcriptional regulator [Halostagnicola sp. A-GB9-2]|uniref:MarR family transcriptional regulator n=1 Tax=Halostagnicola sp. A-GB9-2 TaxID=3048066 RepID=UPI0024C0A6F2|nr:MarR family transcriptional regulator [Halostagnicola sp. A-GB9-2]MDJ1431399.1 MarR family transcriptional regulator [Halostagnicola sp. A-GB9-2]
MKAQLTTTTNADRTPLPTELNSSQAKLVYLYLETTGGATVGELSETLSMKKMATLSVMNSLSTQGLVEKVDDEYIPSN